MPNFKIVSQSARFDWFYPISPLTTVDDIETIPTAVAAPDYHSISVEDLSTVYFDLETTSFHKSCDIVQLATCCGEETFSTYVLPNQIIDSRASEVTGISVISGELYSYGQKVESVTLSTCLTDFVEWLKPLAPVILVAHNCRTFDSYRLVRSVCSADMLGEFQNVVNVFCRYTAFVQSSFPRIAKLQTRTSCAACPSDWLLSTQCPSWCCQFEGHDAQ